MIQLPAAFVEQSRKQLGEEAEAFLQSYHMPRVQGLRINPLKIHLNDEMIMNKLSNLFGLESVPWCETGFYYREESRPGKHPYHFAGLYYIQEPSAMSAVELLAPEPGDVVLDLAAAPGGKSTHIAGKLAGKGLLIANEIHPARAKILAENMERMGVRNAVVVSASPQQLAERFPRFFDKIMVDAPCSGEGMFRKDPEAIEEWSPAHVDMCAARQQDILHSALTMLKPGGRIAYSTCTFNELENERTIESLLKEYPQLKLERTERIWPHIHRGEGHFVALLRMEGEPDDHTRHEVKNRKASGKPKRNERRAEEEAMRQFSALAEELFRGNVLEQSSGEPLLFGDQLYWLPTAPDCPFDSSWLQGLKVLRPGLHLAELKKGRLEPAHALALALPSATAARQVFHLDASDERTARYIKGEMLGNNETLSGWTLVAVDGYPLGWGKQSGSQVKNHYPKGLRR